MARPRQRLLPRLGIAIIGGLLAYFFLLAPVGHLFGIESRRARRAEATAQHRGALGPEARRVRGRRRRRWFVAEVVNALLAASSRGSTRLRRRDRRLRQDRRGVLLRIAVIVLLVYGGLIGLTCVGFKAVPMGFIPEQDKGYLVVNAQLPDGASLERTDAVVQRLSEIARKTPGVAHTIDLPGYSTLLSTNISNVGGMFVILEPFEERAGNAELSATAIADELRKQFAPMLDARVGVFGAPPVDGLGSTGGFKLQVQDRRSAGLRALQGAVQNLALPGQPATRSWPACSAASASTQPQLFVDIDREKAKAQKVSLDDINRDAPGLPRLVLRQRLHVPEPQLAGQRAGRSANPPARSKTSATWRCATPTATACRCER